MLRNRDIELIAGLAEGTLEDEAEARALLDRSDEARAEYEAQSSVFEALRAAGPARMSDDEKAGLRREIWTELRRDPSPTTASTRWVYRLAPVAAALVLVVGALAVLNRGLQGADETAETFADTAGELSAAPTEAASTGGLESTDDDAAEPVGEGDGGLDVAEDLSVPGAMAPDAFFSAIAEMVRSGGLTSATQLQRLSAEETLPREVTMCLESSDLAGYVLYGRATNVEGEGDQATTTDYLVLIPEGVEMGSDTAVMFVSLANCEVVHVER